MLAPQSPAVEQNNPMADGHLPPGQPLQKRSLPESSSNDSRARIYTWAGLSMLPSKSQYFQPTTIHCPMDHLRLTYDPASKTYYCNLRGCPVAYTLEVGYYQLPDAGDEYAREIFYAHAAVCLCESDERHPLYIQDYVANRKVRFWACPVRGCEYEVSQRLEKTQDGWRMCGAFEQSKPIRMRRSGWR